MMKIISFIMFFGGAALLLVASGCMSAGGAKLERTATVEVSTQVDATGGVSAERMLVWKARLSVEVADVNTAAGQIRSIVERHNGLMAGSHISGDDRGWLTIRVPSAKLPTVMGEMDGIGNVTERSVESSDITEQYVDLRARRDSMAALRGRLRQLLERAEKVEDVLAIEKQLGRVQSDLDAMEARLKSMEGQAEYATLSIHINRPTIYGPLGYLFGAIFWGIGKLFVIR